MTEWLVQVAELPLALVGVALGMIMVLDTIPLLGLLVPSDVVILAVMGARGATGTGTIFLSVIGGGLVGFSSTFLAGRHFADRIRASRFGRWIGESRWTAAERMLQQHGGRMVLVAPFLPVFNTLVPLAAGSLRMPYRRFIGAVAIGFGLWAGVLITLATLAQALSGLLPESFGTIATIVIGLVMGWFVMLGARRRFALSEVDPVAEVGVPAPALALAAPVSNVAAPMVPAVTARQRTVASVALAANGSSVRTIASGLVDGWRSGGKRSGIQTRRRRIAAGARWAPPSIGSGPRPPRRAWAMGYTGSPSPCSRRV